MSSCEYCGSDVFAHTPVFVDELVDGEREAVGRFCNYACLTAFIGEEELEIGASCQF